MIIYGEITNEITWLRAGLLQKNIYFKLILSYLKNLTWKLKLFPVFYTEDSKLVGLVTQLNTLWANRWSWLNSYSS